MGRPKLDIDEEQVAELARIHCTMEEIAAVVKCSVDTLENRFSDIIKNARETGKMSLRRALFRMALDGNLGACIWLSKQHLGMADKVEESHDFKHLADHAKQLKALPKEQLVKYAQEELKRVSDT